MKKPLLLLSALCIQASAWAATYSYTGNLYNPATVHNFTAPCSAGDCANFTAAMWPTATITTTVALAPNMTADAIPLSNITAFTIFDGLVTYTNSDPLVTLLFANATTDATGQLTRLQITAMRWQAPGPHSGANMRLDSVNTTSGSLHNVICLATAPAPGGGDVCTQSEGNGSYDSNTSWADPGLLPPGPSTSPQAVPADNPFALVLTATGLLALALRGRRKLLPKE